MLFIDFIQNLKAFWTKICGSYFPRTAI